MKILLTGAAGFIGFHVSKELLETGHTVIAVDNINDYYDTKLKEDRIAQLTTYEHFTFYKEDIAQESLVEKITQSHADITHIVHLAAQAGVRYSTDHPFTYAHSNVVGHIILMEIARYLPNLEHFVYASSSSVYGVENKVPFSVEDRVNTPKSLYAATKRADELLTYSYCHLYGIKATGLRFFTVYGPWGRPDMATFLFTKAIFEGKPIKLFNHGNMMRDFTYIDDVVQGTISALNHVPQSEPPHHLYNIGNNKAVKLDHFVETLESIIGKKAIIEYGDMHPGDLVNTCANIDHTIKDLGFTPKTSIQEGLKHFVNWYKSYYKVD